MYIKIFSSFSLIYKTQELQNILMFVFEIGFISCCCCCRWFQQKLSFKYCTLYSAGLFQFAKNCKNEIRFVDVVSLLIKYSTFILQI